MAENKTRNRWDFNLNFDTFAYITIFKSTYNILKMLSRQ